MKKCVNQGTALFSEYSMGNLRHNVMGLMLFFVSVCALSGLAGASGEATSSVVQVQLEEWRLIIDQQSVKSGRVTFKAVNRGTVVHEMVVIKTGLPADQFRVAGSKVQEDAVGRVIGEIEGFNPGVEETLTLDLSEGSYVLFCNNLEKGQTKGHYQQGMHVAFRVGE